MNKYSVLMSVYHKDKPEWLKCSIDSMLSQTILTDDYVIVKDGPLDKKLNKVIDDYRKKYPKIFHVIELDENKGLANALKIGISKCKNELVARMDADDYSLPNRIEEQLKIFDEHDVDIVGTWYSEFVDNLDNIISTKTFPTDNEDICKYSKTRSPFCHGSIMYKKSKVIMAGNYVSLFVCEDYDLWTRMIKCGCVGYIVPKVLLLVRVNSDMYKRRGGLKYLKSMYKFKKNLLKNKYCNRREFFVSMSAQILVCIMPNCLRSIVYRKFLRK